MDNKLKVFIDLFAFFLERLELRLLYGDAFHQLLSKDLHVVHDIAFLRFFPFVVGFHGMSQMLVDGSADEIVVDRDCAIRLSTLGNRIDLLMDANGDALAYPALLARSLHYSVFLRPALSMVCYSVAEYKAR
jgi:hypothetical protein